MGQGPGLEVGEDLLDDGVAAVLGLGLHQLDRGVGEHRVVSGGGEQLALLTELPGQRGCRRGRAAGGVELADPAPQSAAR